MPTPRDIWQQFQIAEPVSRYPVLNPQPNPGIAGIVSAIGQGAGNALAYRRQLEANLQAAAAKVAEAEAKRLAEAAQVKAEQDAIRNREIELQKMKDKAALDLQKERDKAAGSRAQILADSRGKSTEEQKRKTLADRQKAFTAAEKAYLTERNAILPTGNWRKGSLMSGTSGRFGRADVVNSALIDVDAYRRRLAQ